MTYFARRTAVFKTRYTSSKLKDTKGQLSKIPFLRPNIKPSAVCRLHYFLVLILYLDETCLNCQVLLSRMCYYLVYGIIAMLHDTCSICNTKLFK